MFSYSGWNIGSGVCTIVLRDSSTVCLQYFYSKSILFFPSQLRCLADVVMMVALYLYIQRLCCTTTDPICDSHYQLALSEIPARFREWTIVPDSLIRSTTYTYLNIDFIYCLHPPPPPPLQLPPYSQWMIRNFSQSGLSCTKYSSGHASPALSFNGIMRLSVQSGLLCTKYSSACTSPALSFNSNMLTKPRDS